MTYCINRGTRGEIEEGLFARSLYPRKKVHVAKCEGDLMELRGRVFAGGGRG